MVIVCRHIGDSQVFRNADWNTYAVKHGILLLEQVGISCNHRVDGLNHLFLLGELLLFANQFGNQEFLDSFKVILLDELINRAEQFVSAGIRGQDVTSGRHYSQVRPDSQ